MSARGASVSLADLAAAGRDLPADFTVVLASGPAGGAVPVRCLALLRLLPGRRLVGRAEVDGRIVLLKLFFGPGARRYCERERRGCALLAAAGVATPALRGELAAPAGAPVAAHGLLFEYLDDARPLTGDDAAGMAAAAAELGRLHAHGCRHRDLHLDNFLCAAGSPAAAVAGSGRRPYVIDGDAVRRSRRGPLGARRSRDDLAVLCAQCPPLADRRLPEVFRAYAAARGWPPDAVDARLAALAAAVRRQRRLRLRRYADKCQRDCTEFLGSRSWDRYLVAVRPAFDRDLAALAADPERAFAAAPTLKDGNSATVIRAPVGAGSVVIKRYNVKGLWHAVRRNLRSMPRFRQAWINGQCLHLLGIPTARPLALVERRRGPWRGVAYLIMEDLGNTDLAAEVSAEGLSAARLEQVVTLFQSLQAAELTHGDTKATNFLVTAGGVSLVDLDAMHPGADGLARDLERFVANFEHLPAVRERVRAALAAAGLSHAADRGD